MRELTFSTDQAAFLAGYVAAAMTETGKVGTYGGINIPTVTIFMDGFQAGIEYYNEENGAERRAPRVGLGQPRRRPVHRRLREPGQRPSTTESLIDDGADIIMPVAGPVGLGSIEAIEAGGGDQKLIWVDTDGCVERRGPATCSSPR